MGRLKKKKTGTFDRIGEPVNLEKCPDCCEHPDCFACISGKCTALNIRNEAHCVFYKTTEQAIHENRETFSKLKEAGNSDLIEKYAEALAVLGAFDEEIALSDKEASDLALFAEADYRNQQSQLRLNHVPFHANFSSAEVLNSVHE